MPVAGKGPAAMAAEPLHSGDEENITLVFLPIFQLVFPTSAFPL